MLYVLYSLLHSNESLIIFVLSQRRMSYFNLYLKSSWKSVFLNAWFQGRMFCSPGSVWQCLETPFTLGKVAAGILRVEMDGSFLMDYYVKYHDCLLRPLEACMGVYGLGCVRLTDDTIYSIFVSWKLWIESIGIRSNSWERIWNVMAIAVTNSLSSFCLMTLLYLYSEWKNSTSLADEEGSRNEVMWPFICFCVCRALYSSLAMEWLCVRDHKRILNLVARIRLWFMFEKKKICPYLFFTSDFLLTYDQ